MIPYYSPNYGLIDLFKTLFAREADKKLREFFSNITGKRYILITSSCRSALYLAYKSLGKTGLVHTSPLTCKVALLPILSSGNKIKLSDIKSNDWTLDPDKVAKQIDDTSIAIQAIHLGGYACDMDKLREIADDNDLLLIEDCAQGFGSTYKGNPVGRLGDIACFTLTKNVYGIGGGVFATNNEGFFNKAKSLQGEFDRLSISIIVYRLILHLIGSVRHYDIFNSMFKLIKKLRKSYEYDGKSEIDNFIKEKLYRPHPLLIKSVASRMDKVETLNNIRKKKARLLITEFEGIGFVKQSNPLTESAYTKLFLNNNVFNSRTMIEKLNNMGIEAMHLEHKNQVYYQDRFDTAEMFFDCFQSEGYPNYFNIHDHLVSIPLYESSTENDIELLIEAVDRVIKES